MNRVWQDRTARHVVIVLTFKPSLLALPGEALLFRGHATRHRTVSTFAEERDFNACSAGRSRDEFVTQRRAS